MPKGPLSIKPMRAALATEVSTSALRVLGLGILGSGLRRFVKDSKVAKKFHTGACCSHVSVWGTYGRHHKTRMLLMMMEVPVATMHSVFPFSAGQSHCASNRVMRQLRILEAYPSSHLETDRIETNGSIHYRKETCCTGRAPNLTLQARRSLTVGMKLPE